MSLEGIYKTDPIVIDPKRSAREAAEIMRDYHVGSLIVVSGGAGDERVAGIFTDRDLTREVVAMNVSSEDVIVEDVMMKHPITVSEAQGVYETIRIMENNGIKRVPVVDEQGQLLGIVSADDLLKVLAQEMTDLTNIMDREVLREKLSSPGERHV